MEPMRHVLIVCYDFPWISAAGVIRTYQFAKRLPDYGWQPVILTAQSRIVDRVDDIEVSDGPLGCPDSFGPLQPLRPLRASGCAEPSRRAGDA